MAYKTTIGLEIHTELKTSQKMFCGCSNDPDEKRPNINVCPICLAHPGALPTINKEAVEKVVQVGLALNSEIPSFSKFDRKNYFYPDLPKGYQISQFDAPLCVGGFLEISNPSRIKFSNESRIFGKDSREKFVKNSRRVHITRIHLEEDTARLLHSDKDNSSLVDFNRAGIPLMELVTEPDIKNAEEALVFVKELQLILKYLGVSDADMEKGQMRCEVNISLSNPSRITSNESRIILKDKSYDLMGLLFEIHNKLGPIYKEKNYQDAIEEILKREDIKYEREKNVKLKFENLEISDFFVDFVIEDKIVLEVKAKPFIAKDDLRQASRYIKSLNLPLAIIANFKRQKLEFKRIVNPTFENDSSLFEDNSRSTLGTKVEIKNLNSFRAVGESIKYEIKRQTETLEKGEKIIQETMGWDDVRKKTISQRTKEESHDYRYFPEPDLPPLDLTKLDLDGLKRDLPELPAQKRERFIKEYGLTVQQVELLIIDRFAGKFFEEAASELKLQITRPTSHGRSPGGRANYKLQTLYNYLTSDLFGLMATTKSSFKDLKITPENFAELANIIEKGEISTRTAKDVLKIMFDTSRDPSEIIEKEGLKQISDESGIIEVVKKVISENPKAVEDYKKGKENAIQALIGKAMGQLKGRVKPELLKKLFEENL